MTAQRLDPGREGSAGPAAHDRHLPAIKPLTARSVVLSALLGYHPPALSVRALVRVGALFDIAERATRVALSRMVADGDLETENGVYRLTERLAHRQARQEASVSPRARPWHGDWRMAIVTSPARPQAERVALRRGMVDLRLAELREGVWIRPDNLAGDLDGPDGVVARQCTFFTCRYPDSAELVGRLWDLGRWSREAGRFGVGLAAPTTLRADFMLIAEVVRHLRLDPHLPPPLLPPDWPGGHLRERYLSFRADFADRLRDYSSG